MTDTGHSGSRWEPAHRRDETAELPTAQPPAAQQPMPQDPPFAGSTATTPWTAPAAAPAPPAPKRTRPLAALTAAGLVLVGGAGGFSIGSAAASRGSDTVQQGTTTDGTQGGVPNGPGRLPDSDGDGRPDVGGRPDGDADGFPFDPDRTVPDGDATGDPA